VVSERDDGGPAFPQDQVDDGKPHRFALGMSLRDYFADSAMQTGFQIALDAVMGGDNDPETFGRIIDRVADASYAMANAMLKARKS
jgi:hypothetical protein